MIASRNLLLSVSLACLGALASACSAEKPAATDTAATADSGAPSQQAAHAAAFDPGAPLAAGCDADGAWVHARWTISTDSDGTGDAAAASRVLEMWRGDTWVMYRQPDIEITETWTLAPNNRVKMDRHFDAYQRTIEYQPGDFEESGDAWSAHYQIAQQSFLDARKPVRTEGEGCERTDIYEIENNGETFTLAWRPALRLIQSQAIVRDGFNQSWTLDSVEADSGIVKTEQASLTDYQTTDFADIGDNESDPFLARMIKLGFIEHGASGFYDADGHAISSPGHGHGH